MAIWGVTCLPPQVGHVLVAAARSAAVSTTSKLFLHLSHMNSYLRMGFLLGPSPPRVMSCCILRRSDIKDAMTFLSAEPPVPRAIHQHAVPGGPRSRPGCECIMACSRGDSLTAGGRKAEWVATRGSPQASRRCPEPDPGALLASRGPDEEVHRHTAPRHRSCQRRSQSRAPAADPERGSTADSRATGSGCSIQPDLQDGRIRP